MDSQAGIEEVAHVPLPHGGCATHGLHRGGSRPSCAVGLSPQGGPSEGRGFPPAVPQLRPQARYDQPAAGVQQDRGGPLLGPVAGRRGDAPRVEAVSGGGLGRARHRRESRVLRPQQPTPRESQISRGEDVSREPRNCGHRSTAALRAARQQPQASSRARHPRSLRHGRVGQRQGRYVDLRPYGA